MADLKQEGPLPQKSDGCTNYQNSGMRQTLGMIELHAVTRQEAWEISTNRP
ncbi:hypothetical protein NEICINOT_03607 [Neisseria cinerea ATCC 14685]|jgi:hypothetical protein|uniref:Uncharacterized protein n=1 Tax=Neisseria cinerea ATCC 14685 TaxID=546262 RepID=D0W1T0_NEICI|nr:hypothetical protein [Neisseria cinerea]EEZ72206.1 hypothetical protein NEICINOT_03607 [Neisseria cinerea ATCC 14685]